MGKRTDSIKRGDTFSKTDQPDTSADDKQEATHKARVSAAETETPETADALIAPPFPAPSVEIVRTPSADIVLTTPSEDIMDTIPQSGEEVWETPEPNVETPASVAQARAQIEQTRAEISETIEAIKDKLNPQMIIEEVKADARKRAGEALDVAKDTAKETVGEVREAARNAGANLVRTVRRNPVQAALIGLAAGMLFTAIRGARKRSRRISQ